MSDDELRKLIPALPKTTSWDGDHLYVTTDQANAHALATARAVWAAAIMEKP
jgi:hypothetical protein